MVRVEERCTQEDDSGNADCGDDLDDNDDDCIISLPGESNSNRKDNIEPGSDDDEYCFSNKWQCVKRGKY